MAGIRDIAEKANVSIGTVDRVIHRRGRVAKDTVARVQRAMEELNYRPDIHASNLSRRRRHLIAALIPELTQDSGFWSESAKGIRSAVSELERHRVDIEIYNYDEWIPGSFGDSLDRALSDGARGLLLAPSTVTDRTMLFERIPDGVPYVICDSYIPGTKCMTYVGEDSYRAGRTAGRLMADMVPDGPVVALRSLPGTEHIGLRVNGFLDVVSERNPVTPLAVDFDSTMTDRQTDAFVGALLESNPRIRGVFLSNSHINRIAPAVFRHATGERPRMIGFDLVPKNRELLRSATIDYLIGQRPEEQAYLGIQILYRHIVMHHRFPGEIIVPIDIICAENLDRYSTRLAVEEYATADPSVRRTSLNSI